MFSIKSAVISTVGILSVVALISYQRHKIIELKADRNIYKANTETLIKGIEELRNDSMVQAYQVQTLSLTLDEFKRYRQEDLKQIEELGVKLKRITSVSTQKLEVKAPIKAPLIKEKTSEPDSSEYAIRMENQHISLVGYIKNDSLDAEIRLPIKLQQVIVKIPKHKFLWWTWGCKGFKQVISTDNPYVHLNYTEYIEIR